MKQIFIKISGIWRAKAWQIKAIFDCSQVFCLFRNVLLAQISPKSFISGASVAADDALAYGRLYVVYRVSNQ